MRGSEEAPAAKEGFRQAFVKLRIVLRAPEAFARNVLQEAMIQEDELDVSVIPFIQQENREDIVQRKGP